MSICIMSQALAMMTWNVIWNIMSTQQVGEFRVWTYINNAIQRIIHYAGVQPFHSVACRAFHPPSRSFLCSDSNPPIYQKGWQVLLFHKYPPLLWEIPIIWFVQRELPNSITKYILLYKIMRNIHSTFFSYLIFKLENIYINITVCTFLFSKLHACSNFFLKG